MNVITEKQTEIENPLLYIRLADLVNLVSPTIAVR